MLLSRQCGGLAEQGKERRPYAGTGYGLKRLVFMMYHSLPTLLFSVENIVCENSTSGQKIESGAGNQILETAF
jgi:hypothetical protein